MTKYHTDNITKSGNKVKKGLDTGCNFVVAYSVR